eukprot:1430766-Amphidinium_carterae.1
MNRLSSNLFGDCILLLPSLEEMHGVAFIDHTVAEACSKHTTMCTAGEGLPSFDLICLRLS